MSNKPNEQEEKVVLEKDAASFEENYIDENILADNSSKAKEFVKKFMKRKTAVVAFLIMVFLLVIAIIGPSLAPYDPGAFDYDNILSGPSAKHWFGTDHFGQDIFSRILAGAPQTLGVALSSVIVGAAIGTVLGLLAGYYGGWIEMLVMRGADVLFSFPDILLAIAIVALLGPGIINPGTIQTLIVNFTMRIGSAIMAASSLSFLGFGADVTSPEWGAMLSQSRTYINTAPHMVYFPALIIFITVLAFNLFGDGLRDTLDPKIK